MVGLAALSWQAATDAAEDKPGKETLPPDLARVPVQAVAFISVRPADVWSGRLARGLRDKGGKETAEIIKEVERRTGLTPDNVERFTAVFVKSPDDHPLLFFATIRAFDRNKVFSVLVPGGEEEKHSGQTIFASMWDAAYALSDRVFVMGSKREILSLIDAGKGKRAGGLAPALALAAKKHSGVVGINPAALPPLPEELPPQVTPFKPLLKATLATLAVDLDEKTTAEFRITFPGAREAGAGVESVAAARKLALGFLDQGIKELNENEAMKPILVILEIAQKSLKAAKIDRDGSVVKGSLEMKIDQALAGAVTPNALGRTREAGLRTQSSNNLKMLVLQMHNYDSAMGRLPAQAIYGKDGKPLLSWRVMLLPYLEQSDRLYKQFKLDEPWDSPHNKKLLAKMPRVYQSPTGKPKHPYGTFYQAFVGKGAIFEGKKGIRLVDITDGTSNTIMFVEAANDVPWTKPEDLPFDPEKALPKLGGLHPEPGFLAAFCDGTVRFFSDKIKESTLKKFITRNGGEAVEFDK
jgi:hypothetical protein